MATPKEIIEKIRRQEYLIGVTLPAEAADGANNMRRNLNNALRTLSEDLYSKNTHFALELVQNADDNDYHPGAVPQLGFDLTSSRLTIHNNETGFNEDNVTALCRVGQSTKAKRFGFIGEKGIGFKSVFTVTDSPEIHSNGFHFRFNRTNPDYVLGYVVPEWCGGDEFRTDITTIVLPAKSTNSFTSASLGELTPTILLFLRKLRRIAITDKTTGTVRVYKRDDQEGLVTLTDSLSGATTDTRHQTQRHYRCALHSYSTSHIREEKRVGIAESTMILAFPVDINGSAQAHSTQQLCSFLPVRDFGFRFLIQADFLLSSNREDVHRAPDWNKLARDEVSSAFINALPMLKSDPALRKSFLQYVPRSGDVSDEFFSEAATRIIDGLKASDCILTVSGSWRRPAQVVIPDDELSALFANEDVRRLVGLEYLSQDFDVPTETLRRLGVSDGAGESFVLALLEKEDRLAEKSCDWWRALYRYCEKHIKTGRAIKRFQSINAIKLDGGKLSASSGGNIYFPLERGRRFGFEHELSLLDSKLFRKSNIDEPVAKFLARVGIKEADAHSLISTHILPRHLEWDSPDITGPALVGHVAYVKEHLEAYLEVEVGAGVSKENALSHLGKSLRLRSKKEEARKTYWNIASQTYLGDEFLPTVPLEKLLRGRLDPFTVVDPIYLAFLKDEGKEEALARERKTWRTFFYRIGVNQYPRVNRLAGPGTDYEAGPELRALLEAPNLRVRRLGIEMLDKHWDAFAPYTQAPVFGRPYLPPLDSQFLTYLRSIAAPSQLVGEFKLSETYLNDDTIKAVFGPNAPYLNARIANVAFMDAVRIVRRVDVPACIRRLDEIRGASRNRIRDAKHLYRALETLCETAQDDVADALAEEERIYVPALRDWRKLGEVVWRSSGDFIDSLYPPLSDAYREHESFFCRQLGVPKYPSEPSLVDALVALPTYSDVQEVQRREALSIYKRLDRAVRQRDSSEPDPNWMGRLRREAVFLDHLGRMVEVSNDMYIGDDLRLADAFKAHKQLSFLDVDGAQLPQIQDLLAACEMRRLSESVKCQSVTVGEGVKHPEMTLRIRQRRNSLMRIVYARKHGAFDQASRDGLWEHLARLEVRTTGSLEIDAELSDFSVRVPTDTFRQGRFIYIRTDARGKYDKLAQEICQYLGGEIDDLAESFYRVLTAAEEDLQEFFEVKGYPEIPPAEIFPDSYSGDDEEVDADEEPIESDNDEIEANVDADQASSEAMPSEPVELQQETERPQERVGRFSAQNSSGALPGGEPETPLPNSREIGLGKPQTLSPPAHHEIGQQARDRRERDRQSSGRLVSYAEPGTTSNPMSTGLHEERMSIARAAVEYVVQCEREAGREVTEMPFFNEGFDLHYGLDGAEHYIEVKGLSGAWGAEGVALTPPELRMAERQGNRFWLYVVEFALDPSRRRLYRIQDPFGLTDQFRFDAGWKDISAEVVLPIAPAVGHSITIDGLGEGTIVSVTTSGALHRLLIRLDSGEEVSRTYVPGKMAMGEPE